MKKYLLSLSLLSFLLVPHIYAAPSFSSPVLGEAYRQVNIRIDQKASQITLDADSKKSLEQKKEQLSSTLVAIDKAFRARNKVELSKQAKIFRDEWKEVLAFIGNLEKAGTSSAMLSVDTHQTTGDTEITGKSTDITYYADSFEWARTANGNRFSQSFFSAAACGVPFNTLLQVGKDNTSVIVKTNDRPNCSRYPNLTDLTRTAFKSIGEISSGKLPGTLNLLGSVPKNYIKRMLQTDAFKDLWIALDSGMPNTYLKNETLHITGKELSGKEYTVLYLKSPSGKGITLGAKKGTDGRFEYSYPLEETGVYKMVLASGLGFDTGTFLDITVLEDTLFSAKKFVLSTKKTEQLEKLDIERLELPDFSALYLFHFPSGSFHTLTMRSEKETFVYRGFGIIAIRANTLESADTTKPLFVEVSSQESSTSFSHDTYSSPVTIFSKIMTLSPGYREEKNENITVRESGGNLLIHGIVPKGANVKSEIILTLPTGDVEKYTFDAASIDGDGYMKREKIFEKTIPLRQAGTYLVEVNYDNGFAAYNGPITYGDILPIYPNDYDHGEKKIGNTDAPIAATESLRFVNGVRAKSSESPLSLDDTLTRLATIKANDMAKHHILSHTDSSGDKINGTAKRNNIQIAWGVGENIAGGNVSFRILLVGLANSGGHRANMLNDWKRMGVWYALKDGQVYYVQVFGE